MKLRLFSLAVSITLHMMSTPQAWASESGSLIAFNGETLKVTTVSLERAEEIFAYLMKQKSIPYGYYADGCHLRAQQMVDILRIKSLELAKIIIEPKDPKLRILYKLPAQPWVAPWTYHMAPVILVAEASGFIQTYVLDPSLFSRPVTKDEWLAEVTRSSELNLEQDLSVYYVSRNTFRPDVKDQIFSEVPGKIDRNLPGWLAQFSADYQRNGAFMEKCVLPRQDADGTMSYTRGGLPIEDVETELESYPECTFGDS